MSQCTHCQADLPAGAQFCSHCGTSVEEDQNQSADSTSNDMESRENTSLAEPDQGQSAEATSSNLVAEEGVPLVEGQHPSEEIQHPESVIAGQDADESGQETSSTSEPEVTAETLTLPMESAPAPEQYSSAVTSEMVETQEEDVPTPEQQSPTIASEDLPVNSDQQQTVADEADLPTDQAQTALDEDMLPEPQPAPAHEGKRRSRPGATWLIAIIIVLVVLAGGAGAFTLIRQHTPAGATSQCAGQSSGCAHTTPGGNPANATRITFSGTVSGPMTVSAQPRCQSTSMASLNTLTITFSGDVNGQLYNFGFAIDHYHGPGTYSATTPSLTILLDTPGEATDNGWGNTAPTDTGSITIARGEQTGSIAYQLSGFGTQAGTQVQVSGNWTCG